MRTTPEKPAIKPMECKTCGERELDKFHASNVSNRIAKCIECRAQERKTRNSAELEKARREGKWTCRHCKELPVDSFTPSHIAINLHLCRSCHSAARMELKARRRREAKLEKEAASEERRKARVADYAALVQAKEVTLQDALLLSFTDGEELGRLRHLVQGVQDHSPVAVTPVAVSIP
jgi:hypothetical protein